MPRFAGGQVFEIEQAGEGGKCAIRTLTPNQPLSDTVTASDCWARSGTNYADLFQYTARTAERLRFTLRNTGTDAFHSFILFDSNWGVIPTGPQSYFNPQVTPWITVRPGTYYFEVAGSTTSAPYNLTLETDAGLCQYYVTPSAATFYGNGGTGSIQITTSANCPWSAINGTTGIPDWVSIIGDFSGTGASTINFQVQPYELIGGARTCFIEVAQQRVQLTQLQAQAPDTCEVQPLTLGQTISDAITAADCVAQFFPLQQAQPQATRADRYSFTARAGQPFAIELTSNNSSPTMTLYDAARRVIAQTNGPRLPVTLTDRNFVFPNYLTLPDNQTYFLEIASGSSTAYINYSVKLVTPTQCTYELRQITPAQNQPLAATGGTATIQVVTGTGCAWSFGSPLPAPRFPEWITATGSTSGTGTGTVTFNVAANQQPEVRAGELSLGANLPFILLEQLGPSGTCNVKALTAGQTVTGTLSLADCRIKRRVINGPYPFVWPDSPFSAHEFTFAATAGDQLVVQLRAIPTNLNWQAGRLALFDSTGQPVPEAFGVSRIPTGSAPIPSRRLIVPRTGTYTLYYYQPFASGAYEFTLDLTPRGCGYALESDDTQVLTAGGSGEVRVMATGNCRWAASTTDAWLTIVQGSGEGNGTIRFTAAANTGNATRTGAIQVSGVTLPILQAGAEGQCAPLPLAAGQSRAGTLNRQSCMRANQFVDRYRFTARAGESV